MCQFASRTTLGLLLLLRSREHACRCHATRDAVRERQRRRFRARTVRGADGTAHRLEAPDDAFFESVRT